MQMKDTSTQKGRQCSLNRQLAVVIVFPHIFGRQHLNDVPPFVFIVSFLEFLQLLPEPLEEVRHSRLA